MSTPYSNLVLGEISIRNLIKIALELTFVKNIKTTFYDERFSSDVVFKELRKDSLSISKIRKKLNQMAASYILQGFLDAANFNR